MKTEVADGTLQVDAGAIAGLAALDPTIAKLVARAPGDQRGDAHPRRRHRRRIEAAVLEDREAVPPDDASRRCSWCSSTPSATSRRASSSVRSPTSSRTSNGADTSTAYLWALVGRVHRDRRRLRGEVLPDLRAAVQPERDRRAPPSRLLPLEQARRELLRPRAPRRRRHACRRRPRPDPRRSSSSRRSGSRARSMIFVVAMVAIVIMAPAVLPGGAGARRDHHHHHARPAPVREPGAVVVARRARRGHPEVPGGLRRPPRDPSPRRARDPDPEVRGSELGAPSRPLVGDHPAEHAHRDHPVPGHDDHRARALPGGHPRAATRTLSIGTAVSVALLATTATRPLQQLAPIYNAFLDVRVSWRRLCEPFDEPILPEEGANALRVPTVSTGPSPSSRSRSPTPTRRGPCSTT